MVNNGPLSVAYATSFPQWGQESGVAMVPVLFWWMVCRSGLWKNHAASALYIPAPLGFLSKGGRQAWKGADFDTTVFSPGQFIGYPPTATYREAAHIPHGYS